MHATELFRNVPQSDVEWRGRRLRLPPFYYDAGSIEADFLARTGAVRRLLPSTRLHPLRVSPGHCMVVMMALEYRDTDIGPYNEFMLAVPVTIDAPSPLFTGTLRALPSTPTVYVRHLPVTTEIARDVGIEFLAAPKFIADIRFDDRDDEIRCELAGSGVPILALSVRKGPLRQLQRARNDLITVRGESMLRWQTVRSERASSVSRDASAARVELGTHPVADELRRLGLGRSLEASFAPRFAMTLSAVLESLPRQG